MATRVRTRRGLRVVAALALLLSTLLWATSALAQPRAAGWLVDWLIERYAIERGLEHIAATRLAERAALEAIQARAVATTLDATEQTVVRRALEGVLARDAEVVFGPRRGAVPFVEPLPDDPAVLLRDPAAMRTLTRTPAGRDAVVDWIAHRALTPLRRAPGLAGARASFLADTGPRPIVFRDLDEMRAVYRRLLERGASPSQRYFPVLQRGDFAPAALDAALDTPVRSVRVVNALPATRQHLRAMHTGAPPDVSESHLQGLERSLRALNGGRIAVRPRPTDSRQSVAQVLQALEASPAPGEMRVLLAHSSRPGFLRFSNGEEIALLDLVARSRREAPLLVFACDTARAIPGNGASLQVGTLGPVRAPDAIAAVGRLRAESAGTMGGAVRAIAGAPVTATGHGAPSNEAVSQAIGWAVPIFVFPFVVVYGGGGTLGGGQARPGARGDGT